MTVRNFKELEERINSKKKHTVVVASAHEKSTLEAVIRANEEGRMDYLLTGDGKKILEIADDLGKKINSDNIINTSSDEASAKKAVEAIRNGEADFLQKGLLHTATILKSVVNKETGLGTGKLINHVSIFQMPNYHKIFAITDGGMVIDPDLMKKKGIIENTVELFHKFGVEDPKVACMCALEEVNPKMQETLDARELREMNRRGEIKGCTVEGPISFDIAMTRHAASVKKFDSTVAGDTDIILAPGIAAGNMTIKSLYTLGNAIMAGVVIGAKCPIALTSRDSIPEGRYYSLLLCSSMVD